MVLSQISMGLSLTLLTEIPQDILSTTHTMKSALSYGPSRIAACTTAQVCCRTLSYSGSHSKLSLLHHLTNGLEHYSKVWNMLLPKHCASFLVVEGAKHKNLLFILEGMPQHSWDHGTSKNNDCGRLLTHCRAYFLPSWALVSYLSSPAYS